MVTKLQGCRYYVHDALASPAAVRLHPDYSLCEWPRNKYSQQVWLERALQHSAWRTLEPAEADVIFLAGHDFGHWCAAAVESSLQRTERMGRGVKAHVSREVLCPGRAPAGERPRAYDFDGAAEFVSRTRRRADDPRSVFASIDEGSKAAVLRKLLNDSSVYGDRPRVLVLSNSECPRFFPSGRPPRDLVLLVDRRVRQQADPIGRGDVVVPSVVRGLARLTSTGATQLAPSWRERKLLFFAGHIPKLFVSRVRYAVWRQLRRSKHATTWSHSLGCTVASYEICTDKARMQTEWRTFCREGCNTSVRCSGSSNHLAAMCRLGRYRLVDWASERDDMRRDTRRLTHEQYLEASMRHRFCIVARGDYVSTPKIAEAIQVGAAGGCIPVFVLPEPPDAGRSMLPYTRWLDYCAIGFVVFESSARRNMAAVESRLLEVSEEAADAKRRELRRVRAAFAFRTTSSMSEPSAAEFILEEACRAAGARRAPGGTSEETRSTRHWSSTTLLRKCTLG